MKERSSGGEEHKQVFPRSLAELRRPTRREAQAAAEEAAQMVEELAEERKGKIMRTDNDFLKTQITI